MANRAVINEKIKEKVIHLQQKMEDLDNGKIKEEDLNSKDLCDLNIIYKIKNEQMKKSNNARKETILAKKEAQK